MYVTQDSARHGRSILIVLALAAGISLWAGLRPVSVEAGASVSAAVHCLDAADVLAAQDRSRNGVSLTCNQSTLAKEAVR